MDMGKVLQAVDMVFLNMVKQKLYKMVWIGPGYNFKLKLLPVSNLYNFSRANKEFFIYAHVQLQPEQAHVYLEEKFHGQHIFL